MTEYYISKIYNQYVEDVLNSRVVASKNIILACKRYKEWFKRDDIWFDYDDVDRRIRLVAKMKHFRGAFNKKPFILLPYQQFIFAGIFGWKFKESNLRVTRNVLLFMGRKQGKTSLAAAICLTQLILDNNNGQEIDFIASSGAQARIGFEITKNYAESLDPDGIIFRRFRDTIKMSSTKSEIDVRNSDAMTLDGLNSSTFIADEMHSYKSWDLWNVLKSSQGSQLQPLAVAITTAGFLLDGYPLYEWRKTCIEILKGEKTDDSQFTLLYELDEEDSWDDESKWLKCQPSLGVAVSKDYIRNEVQAAKNQTSLEYGVRTKLMNQFCQSSDIWIPNQYVKAVMKPVNIADFKDEYCYGGVDLSAVSDLTATTIMFPPNPDRAVYPDKFVFKSFVYIPECALDESVNKHIYNNWIKAKAATKTPGNTVDYDWILKDQVDLTDTVSYVLIGYDQYNATQYVISATNAGLPMEAFGQSLGNFNKPTKFLEMLIRSERCVIDDNIAVLWCFNNVKLRIDHFENCKPDKPTLEAKIDPIISMTEALGSWLANGGEGDVTFTS